MIQEYEEDFKEIILLRCLHCFKRMKEAKDKQETPSGQIIYWEGGHFCVPVYRALKKALTQKEEEWDKLVWQQIVREYSDYKYDYALFMYATEKLLIL